MISAVEDEVVLGDDFLSVLGGEVSNVGVVGDRWVESAIKGGG